MHRRFNGGALTLKSVRPGNNGAIARFAEVTDRNAAEALRGTELTITREELPPLGEGEYYHADLLGLNAVSESGEPVGTIVTVENFGAGDVLEIEKPDGKRFMVPMLRKPCPVGTRPRSPSPTAGRNEQGRHAGRPVRHPWQSARAGSGDR